MDWQKHFKEASMRGEPSATPDAPTATWWVRSGLSRWGIGEWGSVASILGVLLWVSDKATQSTPQRSNERVR